MPQLREHLAYRVVASHGLVMFTLFAAPLQLFLVLLSKEDPPVALVAAGLMVVGFIATLLSGPPWLSVRPAAERRRRPLLRWFRMFVGNGDAIQAVARWIDPRWQNPYAGRQPVETERWLASLERMHWATLVGSAGPIAASIYSGHTIFGVTYVAANLLYNVLPNLVLRDTRRRLMRIGAAASRSKP